MDVDNITKIKEGSMQESYTQLRFRSQRPGSTSFQRFLEGDCYQSNVNWRSRSQQHTTQCHGAQDGGGGLTSNKPSLQEKRNLHEIKDWDAIVSNIRIERDSLADGKIDGMWMNLVDGCIDPFPTFRNN